LQEKFTQQITRLRAFADALRDPLQWQNTTITQITVSFMNTADVTVVVTVLANFQIQIVLDL